MIYQKNCLLFWKEFGISMLFIIRKPINSLIQISKSSLIRIHLVECNPIWIHGSWSNRNQSKLIYNQNKITTTIPLSDFIYLWDIYFMGFHKWIWADFGPWHSLSCHRFFCRQETQKRLGRPVVFQEGYHIHHDLVSKRLLNQSWYDLGIFPIIWTEWICLSQFFSFVKWVWDEPITFPSC